MTRSALRCSAALLVAGAAGAVPARAEVPVPPLGGPVVDRAGLLDAAGAARLEALARAARAQDGGQGAQLQFLLVPSLEGETIEEFSIRVAEAWKIGTKASGNGVLVTLARDERIARIEVGGGIEGELPDARAGRIVREVMAPRFREGRFADGLYDGAIEILGALGAVPKGAVRPSPPAVRCGSSALVLFVLFFVFARILSGFGGRRRRSLWGVPWILGGSRWGGGWRGGGGGWGSGGGGGWSGGGGGFSGGGASGRW